MTIAEEAVREEVGGQSKKKKKKEGEGQPTRQPGSYKAGTRWWWEQTGHFLPHTQDHDQIIFLWRLKKF